jgi:hypothetical protein
VLLTVLLVVVSAASTVVAFAGGHLLQPALSVLQGAQILGQLAAVGVWIRALTDVTRAAAENTKLGLELAKLGGELRKQSREEERSSLEERKLASDTTASEATAAKATSRLHYPSDSEIARVQQEQAVFAAQRKGLLFLFLVLGTGVFVTTSITVAQVVRAPLVDALREQQKEISSMSAVKRNETALLGQIQTLRDNNTTLQQALLAAQKRNTDLEKQIAGLDTKLKEAGYVASQLMNFPIVDAPREFKLHMAAAHESVFCWANQGKSPNLYFYFERSRPTAPTAAAYLIATGLVPNQDYGLWIGKSERGPWTKLDLLRSRADSLYKQYQLQDLPAVRGGLIPKDPNVWIVLINEPFAPTAFRSQILGDADRDASILYCHDQGYRAGR